MAGVLDREQRKTERPPPMWARRDLKSRVLTHARRALAVLLVLIATLAGGYLAIVGYDQTSELSVGEIKMSVSPGHRGALDVYVPLVDWGARFEAIRAPLRIRVDLQTVDREVATNLAEGAPFDVENIRAEATAALTDYIKRLIVFTVLSAAGLGLLVAFAIRSQVPRLRRTVPIALTVAIGLGVAMVILIPPRGEIANPQYYAHGPDIPRALEAVEAARRSSGVLDQELDAQLVGLARLVIDPGLRASLEGRPVITVASDLHNNPFGLDVLERTAEGGAVFFAGDLTDRGSPLEIRLLRRAAHVGEPFVFVSGNHDSDLLSRELAGQGAVVLTRNGRLNADGTYGPLIYRWNQLRIAGYDDPFERLSSQGFADRYDPPLDPVQHDLFWSWLQPLIGKVDVVMVHQPELITTALDVLKDDPPARPLVFMVGHTHQADLAEQPGVTIINGGSMGAGGTGNLTEDTPIGIARFVYTLEPAFQPLAADLISIDPGSGDSTARRIILDEEDDQ
jgi:predicted phosphodiesterase